MAKTDGATVHNKSAERARWKLGLAPLVFDLRSLIFSVLISTQRPKFEGQRPDSKAMPHNQGSAILLAAGQSRRMGALKPLLPFGKTTVIESCISYLTTGGVESVVVVVGYRAGEIREQLSNYSVTFAVNPDTTSEMAASIAVGVRKQLMRPSHLSYRD